MCDCINAPIGDHYSEEKLHINWAGAVEKKVDDAPEWASALVAAECGGHRQTYWVDAVTDTKFCNIKGRSKAKPLDAPADFKIVHVWQCAT